MRRNPLLFRRGSLRSSREDDARTRAPAEREWIPACICGSLHSKSIRRRIRDTTDCCDWKSVGTYGDSTAPCGSWSVKVRLEHRNIGGIVSTVRIASIVFNCTVFYIPQTIQNSRVAVCPCVLQSFVLLYHTVVIIIQYNWIVHSSHKHSQLFFLISFFFFFGCSNCKIVYWTTCT